MAEVASLEALSFEYKLDTITIQNAKILFQLNKTRIHKTWLCRVIIGIITLPSGFVVSDSPRANALGHCLRPQSPWAR